MKARGRYRMPEGDIRVGEFANLLRAINDLYEAFAAGALFDYEPFEKRQRLLRSDRNALLRIKKVQSGSDIKVSFEGIDKVIDAVRKFVNEVRFGKERRRREEERATQERHKTDQEREKARQMRIENDRRLLDTFKEFKSMSPLDQEEFLKLTRRSTKAIEDNPNALIPEDI